MNENFQQKLSNLQMLTQIECGEGNAQATEIFFNNLVDFLEKNEPGSIFELICEPGNGSGKNLQKPPHWQRQIKTNIMTLLKPSMDGGEMVPRNNGCTYKYRTSEPNLLVIKDLTPQKAVWFLGVIPVFDN